MYALYHVYGTGFCQHLDNNQCVTTGQSQDNSKRMCTMYTLHTVNSTLTIWTEGGTGAC